jgi:hypothetical protein
MLTGRKRKLCSHSRKWLRIRKLRIHPDRNSTRKTAQRLAAGKENCVDRKDESAVAGSGGKLGTRNAISETVHSENSLSQHGKGYILGMFRRALALPLRGIRSALLNMTMWEDISANGAGVLTPFAIAPNGCERYIFSTRSGSRGNTVKAHKPKASTCSSVS